MMANKRFLLFILLLLVSQAFAQKPNTVKPCESLQGLHYKNGKARVTLKVRYGSIFRSPDEPVLQYLAQRRRLKYSNYIKSCCGGTAIDFIPEDCSTRMEATIRCNFKFNRYNLKAGKTIYLHCTAYNHIPVYVRSITPFVVIDNISFSKP